MYFVLLFLWLAGCDSIVYHQPAYQGHYINEEATAKLKVGMKTSEVLALLGEPDYKNFFHADQWYYIDQKPHGRSGHNVNGLKLVFKADELTAINRFNYKN